MRGGTTFGDPGDTWWWAAWGAVPRMCGPLQALLESRGEVPSTAGSAVVEELHAENLAGAWHDSTAAKPKALGDGAACRVRST